MRWPPRTVRRLPTRPCSFHSPLLNLSRAILVASLAGRSGTLDQDDPNWGVEDEFLFAPYSGFEVVRVTWQDVPTSDRPHEMVLRAAIDNRTVGEDAPLAPWA